MLDHVAVAPRNTWYPDRASIIVSGERAWLQCPHQPQGAADSRRREERTNVTKPAHDEDPGDRTHRRARPAAGRRAQIAPAGHATHEAVCRQRPEHHVPAAA